LKLPAGLLRSKKQEPGVADNDMKGNWFTLELAIEFILEVLPALLEIFLS